MKSSEQDLRALELGTSHEIGLSLCGSQLPIIPFLRTWPQIARIGSTVEVWS
jgi:hypothetical protein